MKKSIQNSFFSLHTWDITILNTLSGSLPQHLNSWSYLLINMSIYMLEVLMNKKDSLTFTILLKRIFLSYMITQKKVSSKCTKTVATYRDSFTLYIRLLNCKRQFKCA